MARTRKMPFTKAVNLRAIRKERDLSVDQVADILDVRDPKHVYALEAGTRALVMSKAGRLAYAVGVPVVIDIEEVGLVDVIVHTKARPAANVLTPGEEAWETLREQRESVECLPHLQSALLRGNRAELVTIYRECVLEPLRAAQRLQTALDARDPTLRVDAHVQEAQEAAGFESTLKHRKPGGVHRVACAI